MNYETVRVQLPNGKVRKAQINAAKTVDGYRSVQIRNRDGEHIFGRVPTRHGLKDGRVLPVEIKARDIRKLGLDDDVFVKFVC